MSFVKITDHYHLNPEAVSDISLKKTPDGRSLLKICFIKLRAPIDLWDGEAEEGWRRWLGLHVTTFAAEPE